MTSKNLLRHVATLLVACCMAVTLPALAGPADDPVGIEASYGSTTDAIHVTWRAVPGSSGYNVYARTVELGWTGYVISYGEWVLANGAPLAGTATAYDIARSDGAMYQVQVRSLDSSLAEVGTSAIVVGYANLAPTAASAALTSNKIGQQPTYQPRVTPTVTDPNYDPNTWAGPQGTDESYTYGVVTQPPAGQGTVFEIYGQLAYLPPPANDFVGTTTFQFSVTDKAGAVLVADGTVTVSQPGPCTPPAPSSLSASQAAYSSQVRLNWTPNGGCSIAGYNIYRAGTKINSQIIPTYSGWSVDTTDATHLSYKVAAVSTGGQEGPQSNAATGWPYLGILPPATVSAVAGNVTNTCSVQVSWSATPTGNATGYVIEYRDQADVWLNDTAWQVYYGPGMPMGNVLTFNVPSLQCGHTYDFSVLAESTSLNKQSAWSAQIASAVAASPTQAPGKVTNFVASKGTVNGNVQLSWTPVAGATSYLIFWYPAATGMSPATRGPQYIDEVTGTSYTFNPYNWGNPLPAFGPTATYLYEVRPRNGVAGEPDWPSNPYGGLVASAAFDYGYPNVAPWSGSAYLDVALTDTSVTSDFYVSDQNLMNSGQGESFTVTLNSDWSTSQPPGTFTTAPSANGLSITWSANGASPADLQNWVGSSGGQVDFTAQVCDRANVCAVGYVTFMAHLPKSAAYNNSYLYNPMVGAGESTYLLVTMDNNGTDPWVGGVDYLGFTTDTAAFFGGNGTVDPTGVQIPVGVTVQPGESYTFSVNVIAPMNNGDYPLVFQMHDASNFYGAKGKDPYSGLAYVTLQVVPPAQGVVTNLYGTYDGSGYVWVSWDDDTSVSNVNRYRVYRKGPGDAYWSVLRDEPFCGETCPARGMGTFGTYDYVTIPGGTAYQYAVAICSSADNCATGSPDYDTSTPTAQVYNGALLPKDSYVSSYAIHSPQCTGCGWWTDITLVNNGTLPWVPGNDRIADVTGDQAFSQVMDGKFGPTASFRELQYQVDPGQSYSFSVMTYAPDTAGYYLMSWQLVGGPDNVTTDPQAPFGQAATDWVWVKDAPVGHLSSLTATQGSVPNAVDLSWSDDPSVSHATQYWVWRKDTNGSNWAPVGAYFIGQGFWVNQGANLVLDGRPLNEDGFNWSVRDPVAVMPASGGDYTYVVGICDLTCTWQWVDNGVTPDPLDPLANGYPGTGDVFPPQVPAGIRATSGTQTDQIVVTWNANPNDGLTTGYKLYRRLASSTATTADFSAWTEATSVAYGTNTFTDPVGTTTTKYVYAVVATNASGTSAGSPEATGYANVAPSSTSAAFGSSTDTASTGAVPSTVDPNVVSGEPETFTYSIVAQPATGQGTASVVANKLVWTPPAAHDFAGTTTFTYRVTDSGGQSVTGTATVTVSATAPNAPTGVTASQGTVTDAVRVTWSTVLGASSYNVYKAGTKVNTVPITALTFDAPNTSAPSAAYTVRAVGAAGGESGDSTSASGYPNIAPSATDAALTATAAVASTPVAPTITDANVTAGQTENFAVVIVTQPAFGTASVAAKKLVWTPAADHAFSGSVTFTYMVTDKAGASVNGTATVTVTGVPPGAPAGVVATQGTLTDAIQLTWLNSANATGYNVYKAGTKVNGTLITGGTAYTDAVTGPGQVAYTVRAVGSTGLESPDSAVVYGHANVAPSATSANLTATAATASAAVTPAVTDANTGEAFTFTVTAQPSAGSAAVVGNKLQWTPAPNHAFAGTTTFGYTAADRAGATVAGTATVVVTAVPLAAPSGLAASQGTVTNAVRLTWNAVSGAASYNVYKSGVVVNTTPISGTTFDAPNTSAARVPYTVRSMSGSGAESGDSIGSSGYPNLAPTSTTATLTATTADASAAVAPAVVDPNVAAGQTETFTVAVTSQPAKGTASVSANKLLWTPGTGATAGAQTFGYSVTDKGGAVVAGTATVNVTLAVVSPITIKFTPTSGMAPVGGGNYLTYSGTNVAGMVTVSGPKGGMTARITSGSSPVQTLVTTGTALLTMVKTENAQVGTPVTYHIEVTPKGSTVPAIADYTFDVKQRGAFLLLRPSFNVNSVTSATINANLGVPAIGGVFAYDPGKQGAWSVQLFSVSSKGVKTPVSTPVTSIPSNGAMSFDVGTLPPGFNLFTAEATQTDAPANTTAPILKSGTVALFVRNGTAIDATLLTRPATGPAPLHGNVGAWPVSSARLADIGEVQMFVSDDGVSGWTRTLDAKGAATKTLFAPQVLTGDSKKFYKATVVNRWSGLTTDTGVGTLQSFVMPAVHVEGPKATIVAHPVTLTAVADNMDASTMQFTWTLRNGPYDNNPQTFTGQSMTYTPTKAGSLSFTLVAKQNAAPGTNALASKTAYYSVLVVPPKMPTPIITGPTVVETGKSYTWTGLQPPPFAASLATDLVIKSQWIMPDGTIQTANPATYVMKAGDQPKVRFESWFDGYPDSLSFTDHVLQGWTYQWPAMKMTMSVLSPYAPARVQYTAGLASPMNATLLHGETLQYAWNFAPGATVVSQTGGTAVVEYPTVGTYQASAVISDSRGNSSTVTSDAVVVLPTKQLVFNLTLTSSDKWNRPPGPVMARTVVTQLPLNDAPKGVTFFVDGVQVGSQVPTGANINLPDPGTYDVKAVFESVKGATAEVTQSITMQTGDRPACVLKKNGNGTTVLWFQAVCTVQRGYIVGQSWKVNGQPSQVTANTISFPAAAIAGTQTVEVTSVTDKGQKGGAVFDIGTGVSTPTAP